MKRILCVFAFAVLCAAPVAAQFSYPTIGPCQTLAGSGTPEGARFGSVCDTYWRTDAPNAGIYVKTSGTATNTGWTQLGGGGTVTSVALTAPGIFSVVGSPVTGSGTLAISLASQSDNLVFASPNGSAGAPTFRQVVFGDWGSNGCLSGAIPKWDGSVWQCGIDVGAATGAPSTATYIVQTASADLSAEQALGTLGTGIVKNTTTTGVLSIAVGGTDYYAPGGTDVAFADGGTGISSASDDTTLVSSGSAWVASALPSCSNATTSKLLYTTSTNAFSCGTDQSGGGGVGVFVVRQPTDSEPPASNFASFDTRNNHPVLDFDAATNESTHFSGVLPDGYAGGGITVTVIWAATSATSGDVVWEAAIERIDSLSLDIDADSFATAQTVTITAAGTSGQVKYSDITFTNGAQMDSLAAGEAFRVKITRNAASGSDTMTGDAELVMLVVKE